MLIIVNAPGLTIKYIIVVYQCLLPIICYLLPITCYLLPVACSGVNPSEVVLQGLAPVGGKAAYYLCAGGTCQLPVTEL